MAHILGLLSFSALLMIEFHLKSNTLNYLADTEKLFFYYLNCTQQNIFDLYLTQYFFVFFFQVSQRVMKYSLKTGNLFTP